jgi:hypothetical protein
MKPNPSYNIDDQFLGVFDNFFNPEDLNLYVKFFEYGKTLGFTSKRQNIDHVEDEDMSLLGNNNHKIFNEWLDFFYGSIPFLDIFFKSILPLYIEKYNVLARDHQNFVVTDFKIQKTLPGEGYHVYHYENQNIRGSRRVLTFLLYLNDVHEGGETEFKYLKVRYKPKFNRLILNPAGFTHTHRGLSPISNEKYVATGWVENIAW